MKKILVICALGYATSTMVKRNIEEYLKSKSIKGWIVEAIGMGMSDGPAKTASIIVSTVTLDQSKYQAPIVNGVPLISGIDADKTLVEIEDIIKKME